MGLTKFQEFFLHKMVHPTVAAGWIKGLKIPSRILLNEVPDTSFIVQGIKEGLYDGSGPAPIEPSFNVLTDGHISLLNFYTGNNYLEYMSAMPMYFAEEMPEDEIPEGWPKTSTFGEAYFMLMIKDPADIDGIKKISINGIDYDTYVIHGEDDFPEPDPSTPANMIVLMAEEDNFQPISSEGMVEFEEQLNDMKEKLAEMEVEDPDNPEIEYYKGLIFVYENWLEAIREFGDGYVVEIIGNIVSLNGLSGNMPFAVHTEYEEGAEEGTMEGTLYEYVEPVYLNWSNDIRWEPDSHSYYTSVNGSGCTPQYATFDKSGNIVRDWTDTDYDSSYIYVSNPEEVRIAARGVSNSGSVVVDPIYQDLYWPHITYQMSTNVSNPGDIQIQISSTFISDGYYNSYPADFVPENPENTPVTGYEMSYSFDGTTWTPIEVALPTYQSDYWYRRDTSVNIQNRWGSNHLRLKVKYSGENGPACECIYEKKDISVAVPDPVYNGLIVRIDGTGADVSMDNWDTPHAGTWYKIDDGEWIKYYNSDTQSYNRPAITDSDSHTLYIQNKTDDGEHGSSVLEVPIQITQKQSPVYMTFTAGEEGASITYSWNGYDNSLCQYSSDHENWETWTKSYNSEPKVLEANEVLYVRNFDRMPAFNTIAGSVTVEGSLDALISPCWNIVPMYTNIQENFRGNMDCSAMTLFSYDFGKRNTGNGGTYDYLFNKNTGTKSFTNFDSIQSNVKAYDHIFSGSSLESTDNLQPGYAYYYAFAGSNLTEMPVLPTLTKITSDGQYYYWPYEYIFNNCSIDVVDDQGNWDFGENNFDFSQGSVLGCSSPKALADWLGIFDPDWRISVNWEDSIKGNSIDVGEPVNSSDYRDEAIIYVDQIPAEGISFRHNVSGAGWLLRYDSNGEGTMVSDNPEYLLVPDGIHSRYYLRVAKIVTLNSIDVKMEGGGEIPEGVFEITQTKLYNGYGRPDTIISNTPYDMVIDAGSQELYIYYSHESGYNVSAQRSLDGGITWSNMYSYDDNYFSTGFSFANIPDSVDIKITVEPKEE